MAVIQIFIFGKTFFLFGFDRLVRDTSAAVTSKSHPDGDDKLTDQHANGASHDTEYNTDNDWEQHKRDELLGGSGEDLDPWARMGEVAVVICLKLSRSHDMVGGETRWISSLAGRGRAMMRVNGPEMVVLRSKPQVMDAFDAEALDFVGCGFGMCLSFANGALDFVHDSADDGTALCVTVVGRLSINRDDDQLRLGSVYVWNPQLRLDGPTSCCALAEFGMLRALILMSSTWMTSLSKPMMLKVISLKMASCPGIGKCFFSLLISRL